MSLTDTQRWFFDANGYVVIPDVLSTSEIAEVSAEVEQLEPGDGSHVALLPAILRSAAVRNLMNHPTVSSVMHDILGLGYRMDHLYGIRMLPGEARALELHGGAAPFDPSCVYQVHNGQIRCALVVVSFQLTDCLGSGGFCCIPGTHQSHFELPGEVRRAGVNGPLVHNPHAPAGSVLIFTEALVHGTQAWRGDGERRSLLFKYSPGHMCWGPAVWASDELKAVLDDKQLRLIEPPSVFTRLQAGQYGGPFAST